MNILKASVLVVEDDNELRQALVDTLEIAGCTVVQADSAEAALKIIPHHALDIVVSDVNMGVMDGIGLLKEIKRSYPQLAVLLITAFASVSMSVDAMRHGAVDYLVKPFKPQLLVETLGRYLGMDYSNDDSQPVAEAPSSQQLLQLARRVAHTDSTVLICGESGTGKEVLARYIHHNSSRKNKTFIAINCAAIPENMLEGMLFGHEKGAFTGAYASAPGKFEQANGGTLLLDEISEMDIGLQAKLLRVIQEREVERLGSRKTIALDVRIIATSNRNLEKEVVTGRFREDLFYRLSVFPLYCEPLRARQQDIVPLAKKLLHMHTIKMGRTFVKLDDTAISALIQHQWPGNVRELDNVVQRALIMQQGTVISDVHLLLNPFQSSSISSFQKEHLMVEGGMNNVECVMEQVVKSDTQIGSISNAVNSKVNRATDACSNDNALGNDLQKREFEIIAETLRSEGGSRKNTAEKLGISPRTLRYKLARMRDVGINLDTTLQRG